MQVSSPFSCKRKERGFRPLSVGFALSSSSLFLLKETPSRFQRNQITLPARMSRKSTEATLYVKEGVSGWLDSVEWVMLTFSFSVDGPELIALCIELLLTV